MLDERLEWVDVERRHRDAVAGAQGQLQPFEAPCLRVERLAGGGGRLPRLEERDVALGCADVPPAPAALVGVGGAAEAEVVALTPVEKVVAALVTRPGPV